MTRMFKTVTRTWSPFTGCLHDCCYCWARDLALGRLKNIPKYREGFQPKFHPWELTKKFKPGEFIGVSLMGDLSFATTGAATGDLCLILDRIREFPQTDFLIQTKNPGRFLLLWWKVNIRLPDNTYLGTTIESNRNYGLSKAPSPHDRFSTLTAYPNKGRKFLSIEPICDFDLEELVSWVRIISPEIVEVGADNYGHQLPEPPWVKVEELLERLRSFVPRVVEKDGLERLKKKEEVLP